MSTSLKLLLGGIFIAIIFLLSGCTTSTTYYSGYYDPYPSWGYRGYRSVHRHHRRGHGHGWGGGGGGGGGHHRPVGRPVQLPSNPKPRPRPSRR